MEQRNSFLVPELVGYARFETLRESVLLNRLQELARVVTIYLPPQRHIVAKTRHEAKVTTRQIGHRLSTSHEISRDGQRPNITM